MRAREIKDLSIALEALSRINGFKFEDLSDRIRELLSDIIKEEEDKPEPAPKHNTDDKDEIPF